MIELGGAKPADTGAHIMQGTDEGFMSDVIEASQTVPVIVEFYAASHGPSGAVGAALEAATTKADGRVKLVKIDVDRYQAYAQQLRLEAIPAVYAFNEGRPVDGFQGNIPPSEINTFVDKIAAMGGDPEEEGLGAAIEAAEAMYEAGEFADAIETFDAILQEEPNSAVAYAGLVRCYLALDDIDQAEATLNGAPAEISEDPALEAVFAQIALAREAANAGPVTELTEQVAADPSNHQARLDLATALHATGQTEDAIAQLLDLFARDREWNDGAARTQLFKIFDALSATDPLVLNGRRKLSSLIFA